MCIYPLLQRRGLGFQAFFCFDLGVSEAPLHIDLPAYEGPLEILLELAKTQKVDLAEISILALVEQYLAFVQQAKRQNLDLAADYLVMAAALAYLKSRLLLPMPEISEDELDPVQAAEALAWRLKRLDAMKTAGQYLMDLPRLGLDRFASAMQPITSVTIRVRYTASLYEVLMAYVGFKKRSEQSVLKLKKAKIFKFEEALERAQRLLSFAIPQWESLHAFLPDIVEGGKTMRRSAIATTLLAGLELTKQGKLELRQETAFAPLYLRAVNV